MLSSHHHLLLLLHKETKLAEKWKLDESDVIKHLAIDDEVIKSDVILAKETFHGP
jgi:hypothetical protein